MTAPDKPGLSNEEFIKKWKEIIPTAEFLPEMGVKLSIFMQALDRLEALIRQGKPTPGQIGGELRPEDGPFKVEVDDHSDDCGTVYRLKGPNVGILSKDEEYLKERAEDFNLGFEMGRRAQEAPVAQVEVYRKALEELKPILRCVCQDEERCHNCWGYKAIKIVESALLTSKPEPVAPVRKWEAENEK